MNMGFWWRIVRLTTLLLRGLLMSATTFVRADARQRHAIIRSWSRQILNQAGVEVRCLDFPADAERPVTLVANHVSWTDIFALNAQHACHFIAKSELKGWPIAGRLLTNVGTIFINRGDRKDTHRLKQVVHDLLAAGETVAVFPEGTTSIGHDVLKFHASLLEPVVAAEGEVWVVAIRYFRAADGARTDAAAYIDDMSLLDSLRSIYGAGRLVAELRFLQAIQCAGLNRRQVAERAEALIRAAIQSKSDDRGCLLGT
jgi:1-acyl-sn-glycerol-3-phosphate acyltransferase